MSMMRLLSAGKSLVDTKTLTPNYRMRGKFHLPNFGGPKNPFAPSAKNKSEPKTIVVAEPNISRSAIAEAIAPSPATVSAEPLKKTQRVPLPAEKLKETKKIAFVAARKTVQQTETKPGAWSKVWSGVKAGFKKLNAFAWAMDHKPKQKSAIPRFVKPAQGELSLDNIKVVRNDLCDSDLEIAPAKTFVAQTNFKPALQPLPENKKADEVKTETPTLFSQTCST